MGPPPGNAPSVTTDLSPWSPWAAPAGARWRPASDVDIAFLFDDAIEDNHFLKDLQREALLGGFQTEHGFRFNPLPFQSGRHAVAGRQTTQFVPGHAAGL